MLAGRKPARVERRSAEFVEFDRPFGPFAVEQELHRAIAMLLVAAEDDDRGGERHRVHRRQLLRMLDRLAPGDVVMVTRIDRLARSTFDLFGIVKRIVDAKAQFRSLAEPWADTGTSTGRLMLAVLGGLADVERDLIRTRTAEGRSRAKAQGKPMGRRPWADPLP